MRASITLYDVAGNLTGPRSVDTDLYAAGLNSTPTTEIGFYHVVNIQGDSPAQRRQRAQRFVNQMRSIPGFQVIADNPYEATFYGRRIFGFNVVYAIEDLREVEGIRQLQKAGRSIPQPTHEEIRRSLRSDYPRVARFQS